MQLTQEDLTITQVVDKFDLTRTAVRKHLTILEEGNLISVTPKGKERITQLNLAGIKLAADWFNYFDSFWDAKLGSLKSAIERDNRQKQRGKKK